MKLPKGKKGLRRKLRDTRAMTAVAVKTAMLEAGKALDGQAQELIALKRILISERAQVIYYTTKYEAFVDRACLDVKAVGFLDLMESEQEVFIKRAILELSEDRGVVPHQQPEKVQTKGIILPN